MSKRNGRSALGSKRLNRTIASRRSVFGAKARHNSASEHYEFGVLILHDATQAPAIRLIERRFGREAQERSVAAASGSCFRVPGASDLGGPRQSRRRARERPFLAARPQPLDDFILRQGVDEIGDCLGSAESAERRHDPRQGSPSDEGQEQLECARLAQLAQRAGGGVDDRVLPEALDRVGDVRGRFQEFDERVLRAERRERLHRSAARLEKTARLPFEKQLTQKGNGLPPTSDRFGDSTVAVMERSERLDRQLKAIPARRQFPLFIRRWDISRAGLCLASYRASQALRKTLATCRPLGAGSPKSRRRLQGIGLRRAGSKQLLGRSRPMSEAGYDGAVGCRFKQQSGSGRR